MRAIPIDTVHHHTGAIGVGVEWGGTHVHRSDPSVAERITDPVQRYLAALGRGSAIPSRNATTGGTGQQVSLNNIAFFSETGNPDNGGVRALTQDNCTFENPCGPTDFSQPGVDTLNSLLPNTIMYFNGGDYLVNGNGSSPVTLNNGQSIHSRTADYSQPAEGAARSTFHGALVLSENNTVDKIILLPTPPSTSVGPGILVSGNNNVINGSQINDDASSFNIEINFGAASGGTVNATQIFGTNIGLSTASPSVSILGSSIISITGNAGATAIQANPSSVTQIQDSIIDVSGNNAVGILATGNAVVTLQDSSVSVDGVFATAIGMQGSTKITIQNSTINTVGNISFAILDRDNAVVDIQDSAIGINGDNAMGIFNMSDPSSVLTLQGSRIDVNGNNTVGIVASAASSSHLIDSLITVRGGGDLAGITSGTTSTVTASNTTIQLFNNGLFGSSDVLEGNDSSTIQVNEGILSVSGSSNPLIKTGIGIIQINNSLCSLNGTSVVCP